MSGQARQKTRASPSRLGTECGALHIGALCDVTLTKTGILCILSLFCLLRHEITAANDGETLTYPVGAEFTVSIDDVLYSQGGPDWAALDVLEPLGVS